MKELWDRIRSLQYGVLVRWFSAIVVIFVYVGPYIQVAAENAVVKIFKDKGFTVEDFKQVQDDVGAVKQTINNINNTLTINATKSEDAAKDRDELKRQIDRLVDFIINKKVENVSP